MASTASTIPQKSWTRLDGVDLLRGLAIFLVLMNHVNMRLLFAHVPYTQGLPRQLVHTLVWNGQRGVQIFFTVSGFLITSTTLRRWGRLSKVSVRDFYLLRFARIAPLLLLLLAILSGFHLAGATNFVVSPKTGGLGRALIAALTFHVNVLEARRGYLPANWDILWSLSVEEMFYLFFPLMCRALARAKLLIPLLLLFVVLGPVARTVLSRGNEVWQEYSYLGGMDAIAIGCLTALLLHRREPSKKGAQIFAICGAATLIVLLGFSTHADKLLGRSGLDMSLLAIGSAMLIAASAATQWRSPRILGPLLGIGQRSYEVYLTHMFVVFAFFGIFMSVGSPLYAVPLLFIAVIIVAGLLGEIVARVYSEPVNRVLRKHCGDGPEKLGSVIESAR
jgi:peptidoglycan/LPS O-acetylase OafA/YrhL